jgi:PAS domain-containing protein
MRKMKKQIIKNHITIKECGSTTLLQDVFDQLQVPVIKYDLLGQCIFVNKAFELMLNISKENLHGNGWIQFISKESRTDFIENWNSLDLPPKILHAFNESHRT